MDNQFISLSSWPQAIMHIDADAFFASCEQAIHPELKGRPVICGKERGIVAAASYMTLGTLLLTLRGIALCTRLGQHVIGGM